VNKLLTGPCCGNEVSSQACAPPAGFPPAVEGCSAAEFKGANPPAAENARDTITPKKAMFLGENVIFLLAQTG